MADSAVMPLQRTASLNSQHTARQRTAILCRHLQRLPMGKRGLQNISASSGPLHGFRILDCTQMVSGPMACCLLADQGADVIKVEPLSGDMMRAKSKTMSGTFATTNHNKRSIALDFKSEAGLKLFKELVRGADVFVQNFRPGVADRLGIGYGALVKVQPRLVYTSISGFGEVGPYKDKRTYDPIIQAMSGLCSIQADENNRPRMMGLIIPDKVSAITAAQAITAALLRRERTGQGEHVRLNMLDAVVSFMWPDAMSKHTFSRDVLPTSNVHSRKDALPASKGARILDLVYETADGYITIATNSIKEFQCLCTALDKQAWLADPRFQDSAGLNRYRHDRLNMIADALAVLPAADALRKLDAHDVPCGPVYHPVQQVLTDPQLRANETVMEVEHPTEGRMKFARPAARFGDGKFRLRHHAPSIGEHTVSILQELGISREEAHALHDRGVVRANVDEPE